jgi:hypothetical protein
MCGISEVRQLRQFSSLIELPQTAATAAPGPAGGAAVRAGGIRGNNCSKQLRTELLRQFSTWKGNETCRNSFN